MQSVGTLDKQGIFERKKINNQVFHKILHIKKSPWKAKPSCVFSRKLLFENARNFVEAVSSCCPNDKKFFSLVQKTPKSILIIERILYTIGNKIFEIKISAILRSIKNRLDFFSQVLKRGGFHIASYYSKKSII